MLTLFDMLLTHCFDKSLFSCKDLVAVMIKFCCYTSHSKSHSYSRPISGATLSESGFDSTNKNHKFEQNMDMSSLFKVFTTNEIF